MRKISREKSKYLKIKKFLKEKVGIKDPVKQAFEIDKLIRFVVLLNEMETENNKIKQKLAMKISEVSIDLVKPKDGLIGFASLIIEDGIYLGNIGIMKRINQDSYRLLFPTRKVNDKSFNLFYPISKEIGQKLEDAVTKKLKEVLKNNDRYSSSFNSSY